MAARRRVGELLDVKPETLRGWIERAEIDAGHRPGVPSATEAHALTVLGDAMWRTEAGLELPGGGNASTYVDDLERRMNSIAIGP